MLFHPPFVCPIPSALYHPSRIPVDISLIVKEYDIAEKRVDISENGVISVKKKGDTTCPTSGHAPLIQGQIRNEDLDI